jgi:hypothetical protein
MISDAHAEVARCTEIAEGESLNCLLRLRELWKYFEKETQNAEPLQNGTDMLAIQKA